MRYILLMTVVALASAQPQSAPTDEREAFQAALAHYEAARWDAAAEAFRAVSGQGGPTAAAARMNLGLAFYHGGRFREAADIFGSLASAADAVVRTYAAFNAGNCAWRLGDKRRAAECYRSAQGLAAEGLQQTGRDSFATGRDAQAAEMLIELHRRATFNLALAAKVGEQPPTETTTASPEPAEPGAGGAETSPKTEPGTADERTAPHTASGSATLPGSPDAAEALRGVLLRDTGPVVKRPGGTASSDEPDW